MSFLENYSNKKKFIALIILSICFSIFIYNRSVKKAFKSYVTYANYLEQINDSSNTKTELEHLKIQTRNLDNIIGKNLKKPDIVQNDILSFISDNKSNVTLSNIKSTHVATNRYYAIYSNQITLEGKFDELFKTIYDIEKKFDKARIASVKLYTKEDYVKKNKILYNEIIFQNYEKK
ncbi:hypothetical protein SAMN04488096_10446 [Mesonia phycicola]|uniref:Type IV pilus assembly protein PilO n=1 Tax=Mesonia phycicola TaxID=579105 RepID=A0A1M6DL47_9FLAO|nr:hypothetical protein [Mesonia phycicola]SHI73708.1 hypothetical protein SAMN04488096_10446 [Mesonia phycicola]